MAQGMKLAMLGGGQMGEAILAGLLGRKTYEAASICVAEPVERRRNELAERYLVKVAEDNALAVRGAGIVILAVKPQAVAQALAAVKGKLEPEAIIFSIVAGSGIEAIASGAGHSIVVRAMPNTPARIGKGITAWKSSASFPEERLPVVKEILDAMGEEVRVKDEAALDMATALSGSGPAYVFLFMEALIDAGVEIGLPRDMAHRLVAGTLLGASELLEREGAHPALLRAQVTSPGGTTAAGLYRLERGGLRTAVADAVRAAFERARELGKK